MLRHPTKKVASDPEWIARIRGQLGNSLSLEAGQRAEMIIGHPRTKEAYDLLARSTERRERLPTIWRNSLRYAQSRPGNFKTYHSFSVAEGSRLMAKYAGNLSSVKSVLSSGGFGDLPGRYFRIHPSRGHRGRVVDGRTPEGAVFQDRRTSRPAKRTGCRPMNRSSRDRGGRQGVRILRRHTPKEGAT
jgi:hypothetical protein